MEWIAIGLGSLGAIVSLTTLILVLTKGALRVENRLTKLETKVELFGDSARSAVAESLSGKAPGNPIGQERWDYLLNKFNSNTLTLQEAQELKSAFVERDKQARNENDTLTILALGFGLALLAIYLGSRQ